MATQKYFLHVTNRDDGRKTVIKTTTDRKGVIAWIFSDDMKQIYLEGTCYNIILDENEKEMSIFDDQFFKMVAESKKNKSKESIDEIKQKFVEDGVWKTYINLTPDEEKKRWRYLQKYLKRS